VRDHRSNNLDLAGLFRITAAQVLSRSARGDAPVDLSHHVGFQSIAVEAAEPE
jgi:hypothetical protein